MKRFSLLVLVCVLLVGAVSLTFAAGSPGPDGQNTTIPDGPKRYAAQEEGGRFKPGTGPRKDWFAELNLTTDQQRNILEIRQDFAKKSLPIKLDLEKNQFELRLLWEENPLNQKAIEAKEKEKVALRVQLITMSRVMFDQIKSVLTPEQQKQFQPKKPHPQGPWVPGQDRPF